jgi:hypothetical protein
MPGTTEIQLSHSFQIVPERLIEAHKRIPLDADDNIPIMVFNRTLMHVEPTLSKLGNGALSMTLDRLFGFTRGVGGDCRLVASQQTNEIIILPDEDELGKWVARFTIANQPSSLDVMLFDEGLCLYAAYAEIALQRRQLL